MKTIKAFFILFAILLFSISSYAQIDLNQPVPIDPDIRTGKLNNGLTYFVKYNKEPEKRASFYFIQNTGALLETDDQNGLAHFLEHMEFNGTSHFPDKGIISTLEKHGVAFDGTNINASTGQDETVYNLSDIPVNAPGLLDSCLLMLYDWSGFASLTDKEIDAERGVIIEEWRKRRDANFRMQEQFIPVLLKDSKYAVRDVIGDTNVIKNFDHQVLRKFYHNWYRTDLQAIAVVGDFDVNEMEKKIIKLFSQLKPPIDPQPRPTFNLPFHQESLYVLATDKEAPQTSVDIFIIRKGTPPTEKNLSYLRDQIVIRLINSMMRTRISELLQKGNPPFISGSVAYSELVRGYDAMNISAVAKPNQEDIALKAIYTEAQRVKKYGFTDSELERAKANLLTNYDNLFKQKDKISNDTYASNMESFFLTKEPMSSIDFEYDFVKKMVPGISSGEIFEEFKKQIGDENRVIIAQGPTGEGVKHISEADAKSIIARVEVADIPPYQDIKLSESLISENLAGSKIIKTVELKQFAAVEWTLANNAKVIYRKADFEKDNVILSAYSLGGTSLYEVDMLPSATMLPMIINTYGIGDFDNITLQKMLSGKKASAGITLGEITEGVTGSSTPRDFEIMMQLLYLRFEKPRFDIEAHNAIMTRYAAFVANLEKDPTKIMQDSVSLFLTNYSPRTILLNDDMLKKVNLDDIKKIYLQRFSNASDFTFFLVGNIQDTIVRALVEKYIGSIKSNKNKETWIDRKVRPPQGKFFKDVRIPLSVPKATVFVSHSANLKYNAYNNLCLKVIQGILDIVYTDKVREEAEGTYGVSVNFASQLFPYSNASDLIMFDCAPERVKDLKAIIYKEIDKMITRGPTEENLNKAVKNLLNKKEESKLHNSYWSNALFDYYFTGLNYNDPGNYEDILKKLTVKDIRKIAKMFYFNANLADIIFRPKTE